MATLQSWIEGARSMLSRAVSWVRSKLRTVLGLSAASVDVSPVVRDGQTGDPVLSIDGLTVYRGLNYLSWDGGDLSIDYDGAPNAYAPQGFGSPLDNLANAGNGSKWWGIETDAQGKPVVQGAADPYPGYYVSTTALTWPGRSGPARYVDSTQISYVALPPVFKELGAKLGDLVYVYSDKTKVGRFAIWADIGPKSKLGEGSLQLARALRVEKSALRSGGLRFEVYPGSGEGRPLSEEEIQKRGASLLQTAARFQGVA